MEPKEDRWEKADANDRSESDDRLVSKLLAEETGTILELAWLESLLDPVFRENDLT